MNTTSSLLKVSKSLFAVALLSVLAAAPSAVAGITGRSIPEMPGVPGGEDRSIPEMPGVPGGEDRSIPEMPGVPGGED